MLGWDNKQQRQREDEFDSCTFETWSVLPLSLTSNQLSALGHHPRRISLFRSSPSCLLFTRSKLAFLSSSRRDLAPGSHSISSASRSPVTFRQLKSSQLSSGIQSCCSSSSPTSPTRVKQALGKSGKQQLSGIFSSVDSVKGCWDCDKVRCLSQSKLANQ